MSMTISRWYRDTLYGGLMDDLSALGDVVTHLRHDEAIDARRLRKRFDAELRLLDDLGWEKEPDAQHFELTMPASELRPIIERVYWMAVNSLANRPHEMDEPTIALCRDATTACPEMLARLADDDFDPDAQRVVVAGAVDE
jgi:hypothetical protein